MSSKANKIKLQLFGLLDSAATNLNFSNNLQRQETYSGAKGHINSDQSVSLWHLKFSKSASESIGHIIIAKKLIASGSFNQSAHT